MGFLTNWILVFCLGLGFEYFVLLDCHATQASLVMTEWEKYCIDFSLNTSCCLIALLTVTILSRRYRFKLIAKKR